MGDQPRSRVSGRTFAPALRGVDTESLLPGRLLAVAMLLCLW